MQSFSLVFAHFSSLFSALLNRSALYLQSGISAWLLSDQSPPKHSFGVFYSIYTLEITTWVGFTFTNLYISGYINLENCAAGPG